MRPADGDADVAELESLLGERLADLVRASVAELDAVAAADGAALARLRAAFPALEPITVPELAADVHDLAALRRVAGHLGYRISSSSEVSPSVAQ